LRQIAKQMQPGTTVAFDGSWSNAWRANECMVAFVEFNQRKTMVYEGIVANLLNSSRYFDVSGHGLEIEAFERTIRRW
jgi:hypothetical protein